MWRKKEWERAEQALQSTLKHRAWFWTSTSCKSSLEKIDSVCVLGERWRTQNWTRCRTEGAHAKRQCKVPCSKSIKRFKGTAECEIKCGTRLSMSTTAHIACLWSLAPCRIPVFHKPLEKKNFNRKSWTLQNVPEIFISTTANPPRGILFFGLSLISILKLKAFLCKLFQNMDVHRSRE